MFGPIELWVLGLRARVAGFLQAARWRQVVLALSVHDLSDSKSIQIWLGLIFILIIILKFF